MGLSLWEELAFLRAPFREELVLQLHFKGKYLILFENQCSHSKDHTNLKMSFRNKIVYTKQEQNKRSPSLQQKELKKESISFLRITYAMEKTQNFEPTFSNPNDFELGRRSQDRSYIGNEN